MSAKLAPISARAWRRRSSRSEEVWSCLESATRGHRAAEITGHLGQVLQVRPKARNASERRAAFGPDGKDTSIGRCGFYLRPAFVCGILRTEDENP